MTQLSPQSKCLPLKWGWVFDLPSEEDLSSQGCPGVWTRLEVSRVLCVLQDEPPGEAVRGGYHGAAGSPLCSLAFRTGAPSKGCIFSYLGSKAGGSEEQPGL